MHKNKSQRDYALEMAEFLMETWRVIVVAVPLQLIGASVAFFYYTHESGLYRMWFGGCVAAPVALLLG